MVHDSKLLPKRIILIRHGESEGNLDTSAYTTTPDHKIPLTESGRMQAREAGTRLHALISCHARSPDWRLYFYVSPYERTRSTLREIGRSFSRRRVIGVREECRIREQDFGNFQVEERMRLTKIAREKFGRFFYRFPEGESAADVFDRVSSFLESLWRDIDMNRLHINPSHELNLIIISHGLTSRVFLMKWFKWTVQQFEQLNNLGNSEIRVMELGQGGEYSLAIHHSEEELQRWGLSPEMIADQKWRVHSNRGEPHDHCSWYPEAFFDHLTDSDKEWDDANDHLTDSDKECDDAHNCSTDSDKKCTDANGEVNLTLDLGCDDANDEMNLIIDQEYDDANDEVNLTLGHECDDANNEVNNANKEVNLTLDHECSDANDEVNDSDKEVNLTLDRGCDDANDEMNLIIDQEYDDANDEVNLTLGHECDDANDEVNNADNEVNLTLDHECSDANDEVNDSTEVKVNVTPDQECDEANGEVTLTLDQLTLTDLDENARLYEQVS